MFERIIIGDSAASGGLRPLDWSELVARLSAERDVRGLFARHGALGGSFAAHAQGITRDASQRGAGERGVNLGSLGSGKRADATTAAAASTADHGDRDK